MPLPSSRVNAADLHAQVAELTGEARDLLDDESIDPATANGVDSLADLWDRVTTEMLRESAAPLPPRRLADLIGVLNKIRSIEEQRARLRVQRQSGMLSRVQAALNEIATATTVDSLLAQAPAAACRLGFDRALVSTVDEAWRLHTMCVVKDPRWAEEIVAVGREEPPHLDRQLVENDTVEGARATLVDDVQENPRVNRPLAEITKSSSYGISPLLVDGDVVGLLHGDYYHQQRILTDDDRSLLSAFAAGLSQNLARVAVIEGVASIRAQIDKLDGWRTPGSLTAASVAASRDDDSVLTRREAQIMRLMAAGDSNGKIARRLVITEATVKTHITRILRKLRASNRAEAVAVWLRSTGTAAVSPSDAR